MIFIFLDEGHYLLYFHDEVCWSHWSCICYKLKSKCFTRLSFATWYSSLLVGFFVESAFEFKSISSPGKFRFSLSMRLGPN